MTIYLKKKQTNKQIKPSDKDSHLHNRLPVNAVCKCRDPWMWIIIAALGAVSMICALVLFLALKKKKTFV